MGSVIVGGAVAAIIALAIRSLWRSRGRACSCGNCGACKGCKTR